MSSTAGEMTSVSVAAACSPAASVTVKPRLASPAVVGVPLNWPSLASARPAGNVPEVTAKVYGAVPPLASSEAV
jgi:hypothetical protein